MKKLTILLSLVLCLAMMFSFTSCGGSNNGGSNNDDVVDADYKEV